MTKPVCVNCRRFYRAKKTGTQFMECMPKNNDAPPGTQAMDQWKPYKLWRADLWECQGCKHQLMISAHEPLAVKHQSNFARDVAEYPPYTSVNDC